MRTFEPSGSIADRRPRYVYIYIYIYMYLYLYLYFQTFVLRRPPATGVFKGPSERRT